MFAFSVQTQKIPWLSLWIKLWLLKSCVHEMTASYTDCNSYRAPSWFENFPEFFRMNEFVTFIFILFLRAVNGLHAGLAPAESRVRVSIQCLLRMQKGAELAGRRGWAQGWMRAPVSSPLQVPRSGLGAGTSARTTYGTMRRVLQNETAGFEHPLFTLFAFWGSTVH